MCAAFGASADVDTFDQSDGVEDGDLVFRDRVNDIFVGQCPGETLCMHGAALR
jgi:hypothetical protein